MGSMNHVLSSQDGLSLFMSMLVVDGAWCVDCGFGTRMTSRAWARCRKCGQRVPRLSSLTPDEQDLYVALERERMQS